jgi:two-component system alkaline phosphatase synthesis response regulator PhoP
MTKAKILVIEDDPNVIIFVVDQLEYMGFEVHTARNGKEGLERVAESMPDLIVLDVMMPEMDGYELCKHIKSSPNTSHIPILLLTAKGQLSDKIEGFEKGADDYLPKPYDKSEFEARVKALLKRSVSSPYHNLRDNCIFSLSFKPERPISIRVNGIITFSSSTKGVLNLNADAYSHQADNLPLFDWRFNSKEWGKQLYNLFFSDHPEVLGIFKQALGEAKYDEKLHIRFESSRDMLRVPIELLFDGIQADGDYLVLKHPLARSITGVQVKCTPLSDGLINDLWVRQEPLMVLLIASNTIPPIPGVDNEIEMLDKFLRELFETKGIRVQIHTIKTQDATYKAVSQELHNCKYHIVHYAGHGSYDKDSPEKSSLYFWEKENCDGEVKSMTITELRMLLRRSNLRFVYLSCCVGTKTGPPSQFLEDDFLGIADGIVHAGVPTILGYRWPVSDLGARTLALSFYQSFIQRGEIDAALLDARCEAAARDRDNITWLSPILIMQA